MKKILLSLLVLSAITYTTHQMHAMQDVLLSTLRNKNSSMTEFRGASDALASMLATRVAQEIPTAAIAIETPCGPTQGAEPVYDIVLVPVMRSGTVLLQSFLQIFQDAKVGFVLLQRDETTALPTFYYDKLPAITQNTRIIILEPMLATGGSLDTTISLLNQRGIPNEHITIVNVICATEGLQRIKRDFPGVNLFYVAEDSELNDKKFIVPGLGDYGDRYYGTTDYSL